MKGEVFLRMSDRDTRDSPPAALSRLDMASFNLPNEMAFQKTQNPMRIVSVLLIERRVTHTPDTVASVIAAGLALLRTAKHKTPLASLSLMRLQKKQIIGGA